jgi:undecaprenyl-diphosphatase
MRSLRPVEATPRVKGLVGLILLLALVALGLLARTTEVTSRDLRIDEAVQHWRFSVATGIFLGLTDAASEIVGVAALLLGVATLLMRRRRWDAVRLLAMAGSAWALAIGVKVLIARPRPPASLWALRPDASGSFPSGHDTTACVLVLVVLMAMNGTVRARFWAVGGSVLFAAAVGASRVYLGDHYPTDVLGSWLAVAAAAMLVWAATDTVAVRRLADAAQAAVGERRMRPARTSSR